MRFAIAILDDDRLWCHAVARFLQPHFDVTTFTDTHSFLTASIAAFDLVMVDFAILPLCRSDSSTNGCDVINQVRQSLSHPPILVLTTAFVSQYDQAELKALLNDADDVLPKDLGLDGILNRLRTLLDRPTQPR
jgi:DNA-binding response OmpR family regulator